MLNILVKINVFLINLYFDESITLNQMVTVFIFRLLYMFHISIKMASNSGNEIAELSCFSLCSVTVKGGQKFCINPNSYWLKVRINYKHITEFNTFIVQTSNQVYQISSVCIDFKLG